jgi:signal transduction histidine kinase
MIREDDRQFHFINIRALHPGCYAYFQVTDTGCGMTPYQLQQVFSPFFTTKPSGRGLGLSTVLDIVNLYKGGISVESKPGLGTTFNIYLPLPTHLGMMPNTSTLH